MLNSAQINALDPRDREAYSALEKLFASKGWKQLVVICRERSAAGVQRAAFATTWEQNRAAIGYAQAYAEIAEMEKSEMAAFEQRANEKLTVTSLVDELENE